MCSMYPGTEEVMVAICCICTVVVLELIPNKSEFVYTQVWDNELFEFDYESGCLFFEDKFCLCGIMI